MGQLVLKARFSFPLSGEWSDDDHGVPCQEALRGGSRRR